MSNENGLPSDETNLQAVRALHVFDLICPCELNIHVKPKRVWFEQWHGRLNNSLGFGPNGVGAHWFTTGYVTHCFVMHLAL